MPLLFTVNGRAERISRRIDFWQAYRRGSVMIGRVVHGRICAWPGTEAQSDSVIGFADVTSHGQTTRKGLEN